MGCKCCNVTAQDLGDCLVASSALMCTQFDVSHRRKITASPRKPIHRSRRSASLTSHTPPLCPVANGQLSPKAMDLLSSLSLASDLKPMSLPKCADAAAAPLCTCASHPQLNSFGELPSLKCHDIISASEIPRHLCTWKDRDQLGGEGDVKTPAPNRRERIEAFEYERRRRSLNSSGQLKKALEIEQAPARPATADQNASCVRSRAERVESFEAERRRDSHKRDKQLLNLLKIQKAQARPSSADRHAIPAKRRAEYEAKRHDEMMRRRERAQEGKEFVRQCLEEWQVPADVTQAVVGKSLLKARFDGTGGIEKDVTLDMVLGSYEEAKNDFFRSKIEVLLAHKCRSGILRDVIGRDPAPWNWIGFLSSKLSDDVLGDHSSSLAQFIEFVTKSPMLACPICADSMFAVSDDGSGVECNFWSATSRKNEHWDNHACGHAFCRSCAKRWAETAINDHKPQIRCPAPGCKYRLWDQDLKELLSSKMFLRHQEHLHADHLVNLKGLAKEDDDLRAWLRSNARPCPDCHVIVSRSEGCNTMICVCGTKFCYACGFKTCQCGVKGRIDIWEPKA